ncbi:rRNA methyltransferase 3, mitochondrial isoform X2 [Periplaneta americana]|uniref:rRNA methyltransferase 3, mitochondrial isoform X2 n=1 Tax=Periplaneta americana TaxID=6978 RepID=UPI0037E8A1C4
MAHLLQIGLRHNLSKVFNITSQLMTVQITSKRQARHIPRRLHRRPLQVFYPEDSNEDTFNYREKLRVERENVQSTFSKTDIENTVLNSHSYGKDTDSIKLKDSSVIKSDYEGNVPHSGLYDTSNNASTSLELEPSSELEIPQKSSSKLKSKKERKLEKKQEMKTLKIKESAAKAGVPVYTKLQDNDPKLSTVMLVAKSKNKKVKRNNIVLEGKRLIKDAILAGYIPQMVFFSRVKDAGDLNLPEGVQLFKVSYKSISLWSDLTTSPGVLAIMKTPPVHEKKPEKDAIPLTIICDNIRDPGNLGSILRGAAGVGCQKVILTKGCVDLWDPKVLRSGAGAHFRTPIVSNVEWNDLESHVDSESQVFIADSNAFVAQDDHESCEDGEENISDSQYKGEEKLETENSNSRSPDIPHNYLKNVPVFPYFAVDFASQDSVILVVGGETEGLSAESFQLVHNRGGVRLNIPLSNNVESLNSGTALGIIVFEIKRQFLTNLRNKFKQGTTQKSEKMSVTNV